MLRYMLIGVLLWFASASASHALEVSQAQVAQKLPAVLTENGLTEADTRRMQAGRIYTIDGVPYTINRGDYIWNGIERHLAKGVAPTAPKAQAASNTPVQRPVQVQPLADTRSWTVELQQARQDQERRMQKVIWVVSITFIVAVLIGLAGFLWWWFNNRKTASPRPVQEPYEIVDHGPFNFDDLPKRDRPLGPHNDNLRAAAHQ